MRFYKNREAEMLNRVSFLLKEHKKEVASTVPALRDFISEFLERVENLESIRLGNPNAVNVETIEKSLVKDAFAEVTFKLQGIKQAAAFKNKNKKPGDINYTLWGLKKLPAEKLIAVYKSNMREVKKIRNLSYYGYSAADLKDAQEYYREFAAKKGAPKLRKKQVAGKNKQLNEGIKECISMLEESIDPLMRRACEDNAALLDHYKSSRKVLARGPGRLTDKEAAYRKSRKWKQNITDEGEKIN